MTLPSGKTLDDNYYTITVTDNKGKTTAGIDVTLKDKNNSVSGATDANGQLIMPTNTHNSYVVGYEDGAFKPENNMTRAEAAAIFARNIAERKGENISSRDVYKRQVWHSYTFWVRFISILYVTLLLMHLSVSVKQLCRVSCLSLRVISPLQSLQHLSQKELYRF